MHNIFHSNRYLPTLFLIWGLILAFLFLFSQKLFENGFALTPGLLWVILMINLPLGAAIYYRFQTYLEKRLWLIFIFGFISLLSELFIFIHFFDSVSFVIDNVLLDINSSTDTVTATYTLFAVIQFVAGVLIFTPLWLSVGVIEMALYNKLSEEKYHTQWLSYVSLIVGLLGGYVFYIFLLSSPHPQWIGTLLLIAATIYFIYYYKEIKYAPLLLTLMIVIFLQTGTFSGQDINVIRNYATQESHSYPSNQPPEIVYDSWNRLLHLTIIEKPEKFEGYYNNLLIWHSNKVNTQESAYQIFNAIIPENSRIAIIGSGGGLQIPPLLSRKPEIIYAIDMVPGLAKIMTALGIEAFDDPRVVSVSRDGRKFIGDSQEKFDIIMLPFTETGTKLSKNILEPSERLFTKEAFQTYKDHLTDNGLLIIIKPNLLFFKATGRYGATLDSVGFSKYEFQVGQENNYFAIGALPQNTEFENLIAQIEQRSDTTKPSDERNFEIITDDNPYIYKYFFSNNFFIHRLHFLLPLLILSLFVIFYSVRTAQLRSREAVTVLATGINYTLLLLVLQLSLFFSIKLPLDAFNFAILIFLTSVTLGALFYKKRLLLILVSFVYLLPLMFLNIALTTTVFSIFALWSGGLFIQLIHRYKSKLTSLLVLDGIGATIAGFIFYFVPFFLGIQILYIITVAIFIITYILVTFTVSKAK